MDAKGQVTRWNYDEYGRVTNKLDQAGAVILRYNYDAEGRLTNRWSAAKTNTFYMYDPVGNLTNINYEVSPDVSLRYDELNRLTRMVDASGTSTYTYTAGNQLRTEDGPFASDTVTNTYQNRLRVALGLQQPTGAWTNGFRYDAARRLTNVTSQAGSFGYEYLGGIGGSGFSSALVKRLVLPNLAAITNKYEGVARLLATHLRTTSGALTNKHDYVYNPAGQRTNEVRADASTVAYAYDKIGQLKIGDSSVAAEDRGYAYDTAWNLNWRTNNLGATAFTVDSRNQLVTAAGFNCTYDANGNLTLYEDGNTMTRYFYDDENRLTTITNGPWAAEPPPPPPETGPSPDGVLALTTVSVTPNTY
jgi:YD repeat-containing protein